MILVLEAGEGDIRCLAELVPGETDVLIDAGAPGDGIIDSIRLLGDGADTGELGLVIEGGLGLRMFSDERSGTPPLGFLPARATSARSTRARARPVAS